MNAPSFRDTDVLVVGAGPTGLVLALWLTLLGVRVRIVDKTAEPGTTSRALAVQARTLELYRPERIAFARRLVSSTDQAFTGVTSDGTIARHIRLDVVPVVIPIFSFAATRRFMFRTISQTVVNYRGSRLSEGRAGSVHGGDRLPWVTADSNDVDNFTPLTSLDWQVHVYGSAAPEIQAVCKERRLPLHVFPWRLESGRADLRRNAVYLVRPDGYVALADPEATAAAITSYFDARGLVPTTRELRSGG